VNVPAAHGVGFADVYLVAYVDANTDAVNASLVCVAVSAADHRRVNVHERG
jgi:hypothetical protein